MRSPRAASSHAARIARAARSITSGAKRASASDASSAAARPSLGMDRARERAAGLVRHQLGQRRIGELGVLPGRGDHRIGEHVRAGFVVLRADQLPAGGDACERPPLAQRTAPAAVAVRTPAPVAEAVGEQLLRLGRQVDGDEVARRPRAVAQRDEAHHRGREHPGGRPQPGPPERRAPLAQAVEHAPVNARRERLQVAGRPRGGQRLEQPGGHRRDRVGIERGVLLSRGERRGAHLGVALIELPGGHRGPRPPQRRPPRRRLGRDVVGDERPHDADRFLAGSDPA